MTLGRKRSPGGYGRQKTNYSGANDIYGKKLDVINHLRQPDDMQITLDEFYGHLTPAKRNTKRKAIHTCSKQRTHIQEMCRVSTGASQRSTHEKGTAMVISIEGREGNQALVEILLHRRGSHLSAHAAAERAIRCGDEGVPSDVFTVAWS